MITASKETKVLSVKGQGNRFSQFDCPMAMSLKIDVNNDAHILLKGLYKSTLLIGNII